MAIEFTVENARAIGRELDRLADESVKTIARSVRDSLAEAGPARTGLLRASVQVVLERDAEQRRTLTRGDTREALAQRGDDILNEPSVGAPQALRVRSGLFYQSPVEADTSYVQTAALRGINRGIKRASAQVEAASRRVVPR